jgi:uncharacterized protein (TIGR03437 family)
LPLRFEPNRGQGDPEVRFLTRSSNSTLLLTQRGATLRLLAGSAKRPGGRRRDTDLQPMPGPGAPGGHAPGNCTGGAVCGGMFEQPRPSASLSMTLSGANPALIEGEDRGAGVSHYLTGGSSDRWLRDVPQFGKVRYHEVYPGIDLVFYGNPQTLEYDFELAPGADPARIQLRFEGHDGLELEANGDLRITTAAGVLRQLRPIAYQAGPAGRREVEAAFRLVGDTEIQLTLGQYDTTRPLVIDPILDYSSILGPGVAAAIAVGPDGSAYVAGGGPPALFPSAQVISPSEFESLAFVAKLNPAGTEVLFSSFFGAVNLRSIALDPHGSPIVAGEIAFMGYPSVNPLQSEVHGFGDAFVAKLTPDGSAFVYATPLGGHAAEAIASVVSDAAGNAYVGGSTISGDFPTVNALQSRLALGGVFRTTNAGEQWTHATDNLNGGTVEDLAISPDSANKVFAATERGLFRTSDGGMTWQEVSGLTISIPPLRSYFASVAIDPQHPLTIFAGGLRSNLANFFKSTDGGQTWRGAGQGLSGTFEDIFTLAIDPANSANVFAGTGGGLYRSQDGGETFAPTTLHRQTMDWSQVAGINAISIAPSNPMVIYVAAAFALFKSTDGGTKFTQLDTGEFNYAFSGVVTDPTDAGIVYVARYSDGAAVLKSIDGGVTWRSASAGLPDRPVGAQVMLAMDPHAASTLYAGFTRGGVYRSTDGAQTWTRRINGLGEGAISSIAIAPSAPATLYAGNFVQAGEGFVAKISPDGSQLLYSTFLGGASQDNVVGLALDAQENLYVAGTTSSADFPVRGASQPELSGPYSTDAFLVKLPPDGSEILFATYLGGSGEEVSATVAVDGEGQAIVAGSTSSDDFPMMQPIQGALKGEGDNFVAKFSADGSTLLYSTYLGGSGYEGPPKVAADEQGRAFVTATSYSADFPQTGGSLLACVPDLGPNPRNAFLVILAPSGERLEHSLLIGGDGPDDPAGVALGPAQRVFLTGRTNSRIFPTARHGFLGERGAGYDGDVFVVRIDSSQPMNSQLRLDCVVSAASFRPDPIAPGQIVSLFGNRLTAGEAVSFEPGADGEIPRELDGIRVLFDGVAAPLLFVSDRQINAIAPSSLAAGTHTSIEVESNGVRSNPARWNTAPSSPAVFVLNEEDYFGLTYGRAAVLNQDGTVNSVSNPAAAGSIISIFATGAGLMTPALADDGITPLQPPWPLPDLAVEVGIHGRATEVLYAGAAPGLVPGVLQINVRLPADLVADDFHSVRLRIGGKANLDDLALHVPIIAVR